MKDFYCCPIHKKNCFIFESISKILANWENDILTLKYPFQSMNVIELKCKQRKDYSRKFSDMPEIWSITLHFFQVQATSFSDPLQETILSNKCESAQREDKNPNKRKN